MKALFCIFTFIRFLTEKCKIQARMAAKKSSQHDALKDSNSSQNVWKFDDRAPKKANLRPKSDFWEALALDDFLNSISQLF